MLARALPSPRNFDDEKLAAIVLGRRAEREEILAGLRVELRRLQALLDVNATPVRRAFIRGMEEALKRTRKSIARRRRGRR